MQKSSYITKISLIFGFFMVLTAILLPSFSLISLLRSPAELSPELLERLLLGGMFFRITLAILGMTLIILPFLPIWTSVDATPAKSSGKLISPLLIGLLLVATVLRFYKLDVGLWHDEIATYINYGHLSFGELISTYDSQNQHFLFSLMARAAFLVFGEGAWALRLPALIFGVASIWAMYLLARQVDSEPVALLSAALLTFSYHHIWFSQNARGYSGLLFWTLLASWLFVRGLEKGRLQDWLFYALTAALGVYTQMTMLFVISGHFLIYLLVLVAKRKPWPNKWRGPILGFGLAGLLTLLLHALVLPQIVDDFMMRKEGTDFGVWQNPVWALFELVQGLRIGFTGGAVIIVGAFVFALGVLGWLRKNPVVVGLLFIPTAICAIVTLATGHNIWPRLFFFAAGFGVLVVIRGVMVLGALLARLLPSPYMIKPEQIGTALGLGLVLVSALSVPFVYGPKQDYQGAQAFVQANLIPGDAVVTAGLASFAYGDFYQTGWTDVRELEMLHQIQAGAARTWVLYAFPPHMQALYPQILDAVQQEFVLVEKFGGTLNGGTVFVYRSDSSVVKSPSAASENSLDQ